MLNELYVVYDIMALEAGPIFSAKNERVAMRNYVGFIKTHPEIATQEYKLYKIATFDTESMEVKSEHKEVNVPLEREELSLFENTEVVEDAES